MVSITGKWIDTNGRSYLVKAIFQLSTASGKSVDLILLLNEGIRSAKLLVREVLHVDHRVTQFAQALLQCYRLLLVLLLEGTPTYMHIYIYIYIHVYIDRIMGLSLPVAHPPNQNAFSEITAEST